MIKCDVSRYILCIKNLLDKYGVEQKELASAINMDPSNLSRILSGKTIPSLSTYFAMVSFFGYQLYVSSDRPF